MKNIKTKVYLYFYTCVALQLTEMNMFTGEKSPDFLDQIMKRMKETTGSIGAFKRVPKKE